MLFVFNCRIVQGSVSLTHIMRYDYTMYNILNDGDEVILALPNFFIVKCINGFEQCLPKSQKLLYDTGNKII